MKIERSGKSTFRFVVKFGGPRPHLPFARTLGWVIDLYLNMKNETIVHRPIDPQYSLLREADVDGDGMIYRKAVFDICFSNIHERYWIEDAIEIYSTIITDLSSLMEQRLITSFTIEVKFNPFQILHHNWRTLWSITKRAERKLP